MAAVMGGTQSLHTNALDEAIALPTEYVLCMRPTIKLNSHKQTNTVSAKEAIE